MKPGQGDSLCGGGARGGGGLASATRTSDILSLNFAHTSPRIQRALDRALAQLVQLAHSGLAQGGLHACLVNRKRAAGCEIKRAKTLARSLTIHWALDWTHTSEFFPVSLLEERRRAESFSGRKLLCRPMPSTEQYCIFQAMQCNAMRCIDPVGKAYSSHLHLHFTKARSASATDVLLIYSYTPPEYPSQ